MAISAVAQQVGGQHCGQISHREIWPAGISTSFTFAKKEEQWNFNHQFLNNTETSPLPSHTLTGKECRLYCSDPPNVPCSALPLAFSATLEEPINLHNSVHRCHDSEAGRGCRSLGHVTLILILIHLRPSINYTYDKLKPVATRRPRWYTPARPKYPPALTEHLCVQPPCLRQNKINILFPIWKTQ